MTGISILEQMQLLLSQAKTTVKAFDNVEDDLDSFTFIEAFISYSGELLTVAETMELESLEVLVSFIETNLSLSTENELAQQKSIWLATVALLQFLIKSQSNESLNVDLVGFLQQNLWPAPMSSEEAVDFKEEIMKTLAALSNDKAEAIEVVSEVAPMDDKAEAIEVSSVDNPEQTAITAEPTNTDDILSSYAHEALGLLKLALEELQPEIKEKLDKLQSTESEAEFIALKKEINAFLERIYYACETVNLEGLRCVFKHLQNNILAITHTTDALKKIIAVINIIINYIIFYLIKPLDKANHQRLIQGISNEVWLQPLEHSKLAQIEQALYEEPLHIQDQIQSEAEIDIPETLTFHPSAEVNPNIFQNFLEEGNQLAIKFSKAIQQLNEDRNAEQLRQVKRLAHNLKGSSALVGLTAIATLTHVLEDILIILEKTPEILSDELYEDLVEASDALGLLFEVACGLEPEDIVDFRAIIEKIVAYYRALSTGENIDYTTISQTSSQQEKPIPEESKPAQTPPTTVVTPVLPVQENPPAVTPVSAAQEDSPAVNLKQPFSVSADNIDQLLTIIGEQMIGLSQLKSQVKQLIQDNKLLLEDNYYTIQQKADQLKNLIHTQGKLVSNIGSHEAFDSLELEQYNEVYSASLQLLESVFDAHQMEYGFQRQLANIYSLFEQQITLQQDLQDTALNTRMIAFDTIVPRLERIIRQTGRSLNKKVAFQVEGTAVAFDREILEAMVPLLIHIIRNAIDHGIESSEQRTAAGKSAAGNIIIKVEHLGNKIQIAVIDDGQGLNYEKIQARAFSMGLIKAEENVSEEQLSQFIFHSGFSTREAVTQVSGRGVGMDIVESTLRDVQGSVRVLSETGQGCSIFIEVPLTLIKLHALIIQIEEQYYAIPSHDLEQVVRGEEGSFIALQDKISFWHQEHNYNLYHLDLLLAIRKDTEQSTWAKRPLLLTPSYPGLAIMVDKVIELRELTLKILGNYMPSVQGVVGISILEEGDVIPILDIKDLIKVNHSTPTPLPKTSQITQNTSSVPVILVVDDSLSVRKGLVQFLSDSGYSVVEARDGVEAIEIVEKQKPAAIFVDLEMPRMNGLEMTRYIRNHPDLKDTPIAMITSRSSQKHRQEASLVGISDYITKPYEEDALLQFLHQYIH